jgi:ABC-type branched-subunit amino acid transport system permease subunit
VRRHTFVVITIAIFFVFQLFAINMGFTGGTTGLNLPFITWNASYYDVPFYYVALGIVLFATLLSASVRRSRFGLQLLAIRDDEDRALGLGVKVAAVKLTGFALSAFAIGMCGALYAMFEGQIYPQFVFDPLFDISIALMAFLGGLGTLVGPLLGGLVLESMQQYLTVTFSNDSLYLILFGALFLLVILFMPQGVIVFLRDRYSKKADRDRSALQLNNVALSEGAT